MAKTKRKSQNRTKLKKPKVIKLTPEQADKILAEILKSNLSKETAELVVKSIKGNRWLIEALERGKLTMNKLKKLLGIETTEKANSRKNKANSNSSDSKEDNSSSGKDESPKKKGHGRNPASAYTNADIVDVEHETLMPGAICPDEYCDGLLYELSEPGVIMRITGGQLAQATRYDLQKLRCAICETIYTAKLPSDAGDKKYDDKFITLLMLNKYFMSIPFYRQENLQRCLGIPLASSTQYELIDAQREVLEALYGAFRFDAAQGKGFSIDDTSAKILEQIAKSKRTDDKKESKTCFTTGIVSAHEDHLNYIFITNKDVAGKCVAPFFELRDESLGLPYVMSDALNANIPKNIAKDLYILCYCLVHARRQFYELPNGYDDLADTVIDLIGKIYDNESNAKSMSADERLSYHQKQSQPIMDELKKFLHAQKEEFEPNGIAGKAIDYVLKRWTELTQFLRHKDVPIDTNITERALKLVIQTRKSSMFYKTLRGAELASFIQTALYSAAQNDVNPYEYMLNVLKYKKHVIEAPSVWLPWNYHKAIESLEDSNGFQGASNAPGTP